MFVIWVLQPHFERGCLELSLPTWWGQRRGCPRGTLHFDCSTSDFFCCAGLHFSVGFLYHAHFLQLKKNGFGSHWRIGKNIGRRPGFKSLHYHLPTVWHWANSQPLCVISSCEDNSLHHAILRIQWNDVWVTALGTLDHSAVQVFTISFESAMPTFKSSEYVMFLTRIKESFLPSFLPLYNLITPWTESTMRLGCNVAPWGLVISSSKPSELSGTRVPTLYSWEEV